MSRCIYQQAWVVGYNTHFGGLVKGSFEQAYYLVALVGSIVHSVDKLLQLLGGYLIDGVWQRIADIVDVLIILYTCIGLHSGPHKECVVPMQPLADSVLCAIDWARGGAVLQQCYCSLQQLHYFECIHIKV
jgi:uncharacterized membrane protein